MNNLQLELTRLIGKKDLTFWCLYKSKDEEKIFIDDWHYIFCDNEVYRDLWIKEPRKICWEYEIIWHPATLPDFHRWMNENVFHWSQSYESIEYDTDWLSYYKIPYDSSKDLLDQDSQVLKQIIELINNNQ